MKTPVRDAKGRFVKAEWSEFTPEERGIYEKPIKISLLVRMAVWVSHNRLSILFHLGYVLLCLCVGMFGGFVGVRQGLR